MIYLVDTAPLVAASDRGDSMREAAQQALLGARGELVVSAPVTQEVDYLLGNRVGQRAQLNFLSDIVSGAFTVECLSRDEYGLVIELSQRYSDLMPGLADLSIVILAARFDTRTVITFDQRHFRSMLPLQGGVFTLLPWDQES